MRGSLGRDMLDCAISKSPQIQAAEQRFPLAERDWNNGKVNFIHVAGLNKLLHSLGPAANLDVVRACRIARPLQRVLNAV